MKAMMTQIQTVVSKGSITKAIFGSDFGDEVMKVTVVMIWGSEKSTAFDRSLVILRPAKPKSAIY